MQNTVNVVEDTSDEEKENDEQELEIVDNELVESVSRCYDDEDDDEYDELSFDRCQELTEFYSRDC